MENGSILLESKINIVIEKPGPQEGGEERQLRASSASAQVQKIPRHVSPRRNLPKNVTGHVGVG